MLLYLFPMLGDLLLMFIRRPSQFQRIKTEADIIFGRAAKRMCGGNQGVIRKSKNKPTIRKNREKRMRKLAEEEEARMMQQGRREA